MFTRPQNVLSVGEICTEPSHFSGWKEDISSSLEVSALNSINLLCVK